MFVSDRSPESNSASNLSPQAPIADTVSLKDDRVMFNLPPEFTEMSADEIDSKFPPGSHQPQHVYANPERSVSISVTCADEKVMPHQLPELQTVLRNSLGQVFLSAEWKREEIIRINQTPWIHLEFVSQAIDTQINNDTYFTSFDGRMLGFNFNATVEQYEANRAELEENARFNQDSFTR
jgi:hypothetical protein